MLYTVEITCKRGQEELGLFVGRNSREDLKRSILHHNDINSVYIFPIYTCDYSSVETYACFQYEVVWVLETIL